jgi:hypothetical protein
LLQAQLKGELGLMLNKKLIPVVIPFVALVLLIAALMSVGAQPKPAVNIPPGQIVDSPNAQMPNDTPRPPVPAAPALSAGQPGALTETFEGKALDAWRTISDSPLTWVAQDGRLQQYLPLEDEIADVPLLFVSKDAGFGDASVEAYVYPTSGQQVGLVLRGSYQGYYRVTLYMNVPTNTASKARIERVTPTKTDLVAEAPVSTYPGYALERWQHVQATVQGTTITISVDGKQIMSATDSALGSSAFSKGWAGVWSLADQGASFDNLRIQPSAAR